MTYTEFKAYVETFLASTNHDHLTPSEWNRHRTVLASLKEEVTEVKTKTVAK